MSSDYMLSKLNVTLLEILAELKKANRVAEGKPVVVVQNWEAPSALSVVPHGNNYNCGDGTGCRCGS